MNKKEQILQAIEKAERLESKLTEECLKIGGFTSPRIRHLMNNLGAISTNYLECGVHRGSTFIAANYGNDMYGVAIDNFSEFEDGTVQKELIENLRMLKDDSYNLIVENCFSQGLLEGVCFNADTGKSIYLIPKNIDLYLYDSAHDYESQKKSVIHFYENLADESIFIADDADWADVFNGTLAGLQEIGCQYELISLLTGKDWHNGLVIYLIKKK